MHRSSRRWTSLFAIVLDFLIEVMVLTTQALILTPYCFQLVAERLELHRCIASLLGVLFKVSDVIGSYTKVRSDDHG